MLQKSNQLFALESERAFLGNLHALHPQPEQVLFGHGRCCVLVPKRLTVLGRNPQSRDAPKGSERRYPKIFQVPTKSLGHQAVIGPRGSQQRSCRPIFRVPQGIAKCPTALLRSRESVSVELHGLASPDFQRELQLPEPGSQTPVRNIETIRLLYSRLLRERSRA